MSRLAQAARRRVLCWVHVHRSICGRLSRSSVVGSSIWSSNDRQCRNNEACETSGFLPALTNAATVARRTWPRERGHATRRSRGRGRSIFSAAPPRHMIRPSRSHHPRRSRHDWPILGGRPRSVHRKPCGLGEIQAGGIGSAPTEPRTVATGEAKPAVRRAQRNPWKEGVLTSPPRRGGGKPTPLTVNRLHTYPQTQPCGRGATG
jgi:hypothetical protein